MSTAAQYFTMGVFTGSLLLLLLLQPWFVVERTALSDAEILVEARKRRLSDDVIDKIRVKGVCTERFAISKPVLYMLEPCETQVRFGIMALLCLGCN